MSKMKPWTACTLPQKIERWENAERVLTSMTPHERRKHWNMSVWGIATECGTVHCAAGKCGLDPWFRRRGLKLKPVSVQDVLLKMTDNSYDEVPSELTLKDILRTDFEDTHGDFEGEYDTTIGPVPTFFGETGARAVFYNPTLRPVSTVIKEIKHYIRFLKAIPRLVKQANENVEDTEYHYTVASFEGEYDPLVRYS